MSLRRDYATTQASFVQEVLHIAAGYTEPMHTLNHTLAQLDVLISFAHASAVAPLPYVRPVILPKGLQEHNELIMYCSYSSLKNI